MLDPKNICTSEEKVSSKRVHHPEIFELTQYKYGVTRMHKCAREGEDEFLLALLRGQKQQFAFVEEETVTLSKNETKPPIKIKKYKKVPSLSYLSLLEKAMLKDLYGKTVLECAMEGGCRKSVGLMLSLMIQNECGFLPDDQKNLLMLCVYLGNESLLKCLLLNKKRLRIDVNQQDEMGDTVIHYVIDNALLPMLEILIKDSEIDLTRKNKKLRTPLHRAARLGKVEILDILLQNKQVKNTILTRDYHKKTPISIAAHRGHEHFLIRLVELQGTRMVLSLTFIKNIFDNIKYMNHICAIAGQNECKEAALYLSRYLEIIENCLEYPTFDRDKIDDIFPRKLPALTKFKRLKYIETSEPEKKLELEMIDISDSTQKLRIPTD